jgi:hypothetical protein
VTQRFSSIATALGGRPGPRGARGPAGGGGGAPAEYVATAALGGHRVVKADGDDGVAYASNDAPGDAHLAFGLTTAAASEGALVPVQSEGRVTEAGWSWTPDMPVFLGQGGQLTQVPPTPVGSPQPRFILIVGVAVSPTQVNLDFKTPIAF